MISANPAWDEFLRSHRWAVLTTLRTSGSPVSAVVAYALDGDELVVSTPQTTFRHASIARDERVNLCAFSNQEPFNFVAVEGRCDIERTDLVRTTKLVFKAIEGTGYEEPADLPGWLAEQQRVILRIKPTRVYGVIR
ncbi:MAG: hypothetical protein F4Z45_12605 [Gammaproteobacteria bacterium]|nr:hypothetical protein [Gammaproteobacteria bacterium]